jgi:hypothetical protein
MEVIPDRLFCTFRKLENAWAVPLPVDLTQCMLSLEHCWKSGSPVLARKAGAVGVHDVQLLNR